MVRTHAPSSHRNATSTNAPTTVLKPTTQLYVDLDHLVDTEPQRPSFRGITHELIKPAEVGVQAKLTIGAANDKYEKEADQIATEIVHNMRTRLRPLPVEQPLSRIETGNIQRDSKQHVIGPEGGDSPVEFTAALQRARGGGSGLPQQMQHAMGQYLLADLQGIRIHTDASAHALTDAIRAKAFTQGNDIFFGEGYYKPGTRAGDELIAHEAIHHLQQMGVKKLGGKRESSEMSQSRRPVGGSTASVGSTYRTGENAKMAKDAATKREGGRGQYQEKDARYDNVTGRDSQQAVVQREFEYVVKMQEGYGYQNEQGKKMSVDEWQKNLKKPIERIQAASQYANNSTNDRANREERSKMVRIEAKALQRAGAQLLTTKGAPYYLADLSDRGKTDGNIRTVINLLKDQETKKKDAQVKVEAVEKLSQEILNGDGPKDTQWYYKIRQVAAATESIERKGVTLLTLRGAVDGRQMTDKVVEYNDDQRKGDSKVEVIEGRFTQGTTELDTTQMVGHNSGPGYAMYVLMRDGTLYVGEQRIGQRHHSSLAQGNEVASAGELVVTNGRLQEVNDLSGHYRPSSRHLRQMLTYLGAHGVEIREVTINKFLSVEGGEPKYSEWREWHDYDLNAESKNSKWLKAKDEEEEESARASAIERKNRLQEWAGNYP